MKKENIREGRDGKRSDQNWSLSEERLLGLFIYFHTEMLALLGRKQMYGQKRRAPGNEFCSQLKQLFLQLTLVKPVETAAKRATPILRESGVTMCNRYSISYRLRPLKRCRYGDCTLSQLMNAHCSDSTLISLFHPQPSDLISFN